MTERGIKGWTPELKLAEQEFVAAQELAAKGNDPTAIDVAQERFETFVELHNQVVGRHQGAQVAKKTRRPVQFADRSPADTPLVIVNDAERRARVLTARDVARVRLLDERVRALETREILWATVLAGRWRIVQWVFPGPVRLAVREIERLSDTKVAVLTDRWRREGDAPPRHLRPIL